MMFSRRGSSVVISSFAILSLAAICAAQDNAATQSWSATSQQGAADGSVNPTRTRQTHTQSGGRVGDKTSTETLGPDGRYVPYSDTETESHRLSDTATRTIVRTYGRDADGHRILIQQKEEESRTLPGGAQKVTRTVSNPDANGSLQVVQREVEDSKQISPNVRMTQKSVLTPDSDGHFSPAVQSERRETKGSDGSVQSKTSTQLPDGNGGWTLSEVRQSTTRQNGQLTSKEEQVLRPDANGNLAVIERTVNQQTQSSTGEKRDTTETYSTNVPGEAGNGNLQLVQREATLHRTTASGAQSTVRQTEQPRPGDFSGGLQVTQQAIDIVRPGSNGTTAESHTILAPDADGRLNQVWVDFGTTNKPPAITVDTTTPAKKK